MINSPREVPVTQFCIVLYFWESKNRKHRLQGKDKRMKKGGDSRMGKSIQQLRKFFYQ